MPPWLRRAIVLLLLGAAALYIGFWLAGRLRSLIVMLLVSLFLAFAMEPAANYLARRGWRRGLATATVFAVLVGVVVVLVTALGSLFVDQISQLIDAIPGYAQQFADFLNDRLGTDLEASKLASELRSSQGVRSFVTGVAAATVGLSTTLVGLLLQSFTVGLFTFYLVADGPRLRRTVCSVLPPDRQQLWLRIWELATESTGGYVYSRALLAGVSATATTLFLFLVGVPYPLALGISGGPGVAVRAHHRHLPGGRPAGADRPVPRPGRRRVGARLHHPLPAVREPGAVSSGHRADDVAASGRRLWGGDRRRGHSRPDRRLAGPAGGGKHPGPGVLTLTATRSWPAR